MIEWKQERIIKASIENVWSLFQADQLQRIMPKVTKHELVEHVEGEVGTKYEQSYKEGKRQETYIVETLAYEDKPDYKHQHVFFVLGKAFEIHTDYQLEKVDEHQTRFIYKGQNKGSNFVGRAMLKLAGRKGQKGQAQVVTDFMDRVEEEAVKNEEEAS